MHFDIDHLRNLLRDVPLTASFSQSIELLEDAFDYSDRDPTAPPWYRFRSGDDATFFGEQTLRALLGKDFREDMPARYYWSGSLDPDDPRALRPHVQRYVVVGYRPEGGGACVLFHSGNVIFFDDAAGPPTESVAALELVRVRSGLMNRRQAHLLANHLNRFRRNRHHGEVLNWVVKRGPDADSSAREWLDAVMGDCQYLRQTVGELPTWGLGANAAGHLVMYVVQPRMVAHRSQVFTYGAAQYLLPPRFAVRVVEKAPQGDVPVGQSWDATRTSECDEAKRVADVCEWNGLIDGTYSNQGASPKDMWGIDDNNSAPGGDDGISPPAAEVYATSFSRQEVTRVMRALRKGGYYNIRAERIGADGTYVRWEAGMQYFRRYEVHVSRELLVDDEPSLGINLHTIVMQNELD